MFEEAYDSPNAVAADDYEKKYMSGEGALASSRARMPWFFDVLLLFLAAFTTATSIASGTWVALATVPMLLLVWLLFMFLRVTVTPDTLHVQLGLFGPKIAMNEITSATVAKYDALKYGGWGIRMGLDGSIAYSLPGHGGKGVAVTFTKNGKERKMFVTCPNAEEIVTAIEKARAGVRVVEDVRVGEAEEMEDRGEERRGGEMKRVALVFVLACGGQAAPPPSHVTAIVDRDVWIAQFSVALPVALCRDNFYFRSCFTVTAEECERTAASATRICLAKFKKQLPEKFHQPDEGTEWGSKIGNCVGTAYEVALPSHRISNAKCNDASQWTTPP